MSSGSSGGCSAEFSYVQCGGDNGFWGGGGWGDVFAGYGGMSAAELEYEGRLQNTRDGLAAQRALDRGDYHALAEILNSNPNVGLSGNPNIGLSEGGEESSESRGLMLDYLMAGGFGHAFQRGGVITRPPSSRRQRFPNLRDHSRRHEIGNRTLTRGQYLQSAVRHTQRHHGRYTINYHVNGHNFQRVNYVSRVGPDSFIFTSTSPNGRTIFTHMQVNGNYIRNQGIHVNSYPPNFVGPVGLP
jgi:hypothetical protein